MTIFVLWLPVLHPEFIEDKNDQFSMEDGTLILYDNSKAFAAYLKKQGLDRVLSRTGLKLRANHTITPHVRASK